MRKNTKETNICVNLKSVIYLNDQVLEYIYHMHDTTESQFLRRLKLIWIQSFPELHIVLLNYQIAFLKFTSCNIQALVGCIPIAVVAVHLKMKS